MQFRLSRMVMLTLLMLLLTACGGNGDADTDAEPTLAITSSGLGVSSAWIRPAVLPEGSPTPAEHDHEGDDAPPSGVISAMYLVIENRESQSVQLVSVETPAARVTEMHETQNDNGMLRMRPVEQVEVPGQGSVTFEPGGLHVMLIDVVEALEPGDTVPVTLVFNTGERLELPDVPVQDS